MENKKILLANSLLLAALSLFILIPVIVNKLFGLNGSISGNVSLIISGSASVIGLGGISLLYCKIIKGRFIEVMVIRIISLKQVILTMFVAVGTYIFAIGINSLSMKLFPIVIEDGMKISNLLSGSSTLLGLIVVVMIPAFFEEIFFRGVLLDAYEGVNKKIKYFILILIFSSFHGNLMQIIYVMFLGLILLKVREYTGSLLGSIILHAANNGISFAISKLAAGYMKLIDSGIKKGAMDPAQAAAAAEEMNVSLVVALLRSSIFFLIGGAILFINLRKLKEYKEKKEGLGLIQDDYMDIKEESVEIKEEIIEIEKKQYIPLAIYFVAITVLVVSSYIGR